MINGKRFFTALLMIVLIVLIPVNASVSLNQNFDKVYSTDGLNKEKIIPYKLDKISDQSNKNITLDYAHKLIFNVELSTVPTRDNTFFNVNLTLEQNNLKRNIPPELTLPQAENYELKDDDSFLPIEENYGVGISEIKDTSPEISDVAVSESQPEVSPSNPVGNYDEVSSLQETSYGMNIGITSTSSVSCYFHAGGACNFKCLPSSCTPSCSGTLGGCVSTVDNGYYYCYNEDECSSSSGCDSGGADYKKECNCDVGTCTNPSYPNYCGNSCWGDCSSGSWNCKANGQATCCSSSHPYYCDVTESCWTSQSYCDRAQYCGGSWHVCTSTSYHPTCSNGDFHCCPGESPYWCEKTQGCWSNQDDCDNAEYCNGNNYICNDPSTSLCCPSSGAPSYCCGSGQVCQSDGTCLTPECTSDSDCASKDTYYCDGDYIMERDYYCSGYQCVYDDSEYADCSINNYWYCVDGNTKGYADHFCAISGSTIFCDYTTINQQDCPYGCSGGNCVTSTNVHGYMKYSDGSGIQNVKFKLEDCSTGSTIAYDHTDSNGYYSINANAGNYVLSADYLGYDIDLTECTALAGDVSVQDITLSASLSGYIKDSGGNGNPNIPVKLTDCSGNIIDTGTTDSDGYFKVDAADAGYFDFYLNYLGEDIHVLDCEAIAGNVQFSEQIVLTASLSGYIKDSSGNGKPNIPVKLTDCSATNIFDTGTTDSNGYFKVDAADAGYFDFYFTYLGYNLEVLDCESIVGSAQFSEPILLTATLHGYLKDLDDNPLEGYGIELYDCSENFVDSVQTSSTGYFSITEDAAKYMIMIDMGGWKLKLVDQDDNDCLFLLGDIDAGTLNINPTLDCSIFDYLCYQGNIKLFGCYWDDVGKGCYCYGTECLYGCTDGLPECDSGDYGAIVVDVDDLDNNPFQGAKVYMDYNLKGHTDSNGKLSFSALYGYRDIEVNCPDGSYCGQRQVYVNGDEYLYFDCECLNLDSDNDGYTDEEERIIGFDPYDASSNLGSAYPNRDFSVSCWDFTPLFS